MPRMVGRWVLASWLVLGMAATALAQADEEDVGDGETQVAEPPTDERARAYFVLGRTAYDAGDYAEAIEQFGRAYELSQRADLLYNLYQAHHRAGNLEEAVDYLERYLEQGSPDDLQRGTLTERLSNLRGQVEQERERREREAAEAEQRRQEELARTRADAQSHSMRNAGIAVLSIGAAAGVMFGILAGLALKEDGELEDLCSPVCTGDQISRLRAYNRGADVSMALAGIGIATGLVLVLLARDDDEVAETARARVSPTFGARGAGLGVEGRF